MAVISVNLTDTFEQWRTKTNTLCTQQGDLTTLTTTAKNTMVAAINEIDAAVAGISNVVEDTTPQLGGNLDVLARIITTSTTNGNIAITPHGSGKVVLDGISHPNADGTNGQVLQTNGSGVLSFATISSDPTMGGDLSGTASNAQIVANAVTATEIASNAVTTAKINADAVDGTKLADNACDSEHYTEGSIDLAHMSANSVDSDQYVDGSIDDAHLATGITASKLTGNLPAINGSALTNLTASNLTTGNYPALNGSAITTLNASHIASGTLNTARLPATIDVTTVDLGYWTVTENGSGELLFQHSGTSKMKLNSSGNLTVVGNVTAYGSM